MNQVPKSFLFLLICISSLMSFCKGKSKFFLVETEDHVADHGSDFEADAAPALSGNLFDHAGIIDTPKNPCGKGIKPSSCTCSDGKEMSENNICICTDYTCPDGSTFKTDFDDLINSPENRCGKGKKPKSCTCKDGEKLSKNNICIPTQCTCNNGETLTLGKSSDFPSDEKDQDYNGCYSNCCFSNSTMVETQYGIKPISSLQLGDKVFTLNPESNQKEVTEFLGWMGRDSFKKVEYVVIHTDQEAQITLTASHNIFYYTNQQTIASRPAREMRIGDVMLQWTGERTDLVRVVKIEKTVEVSYWSPLTSSGTLLANNVLVSCYASYPHWVGQLPTSLLKPWSTLVLDDHQSQYQDGDRWIVRIVKWIANALQLRYGDNKDDVKENSNDIVMKTNANAKTFSVKSEM